MRETVASLNNFEVYPSVICIQGEIIFIYKLLWNVFKADSEKLLSVHRRGQVKISDVKSDKARMAAGEYAVDDKFDKLDQACRCADVPRVADYISSNDCLGLVGIFHVGPLLAYNFGVRDLVTEVMGDIFVSDNLDVSVTSTRCCLGPLETLPMLWHSRPSIAD